MPFGPERTYLTETRGHRWELDPDSDDGFWIAGRQSSCAE